MPVVTGRARKDAGQDADLVGLAALGHEARLAGAAAVEPGLDVGLGQRDAGRAAIDDAADGRAVALAPGGDAEEMAEAVVRHGRASSLGGQPCDVGRARILAFRRCGSRRPHGATSPVTPADRSLSR